MSRRDRISEFTRPVERTVRRESVRGRIQPEETAVISPKPLHKPRTNTDIKRHAPKRPPTTPRQDRSRVLQRQGLKKLPEFKPKSVERRFNIRLAGFSALAIMLLMATPYLFYRILSNDSGLVKGIKNSILSGERIPTYFTSSSIMDVAARVEAVDSINDDSNSMSNMRNLGWYQKSARPSEPGVVVIVGHVSGPDYTGALHNLHSMEKGDSIQLETGDGRIINYKVEETKKYLPNEVSEEQLMRPISEGKRGMNIVSFTDRINPNSELGKYRYVVYAVEESN